jgi:hypothetical protein
MNMTYKEAVKLIHPDVCKKVVDDVGTKMSTLKEIRNNEAAIYRYMVIWGLVPGVSPNAEKKPEWLKIMILGYQNYAAAGWVVYAKVRGIVDGETVNVRVTRTTKKRVYFHSESVVKYGRKCVDIEKVVLAARYIGEEF